MRYVGDGFAVDAAAFVVERDGAPVELEPQAMDLLLYMVARPGDLLTKAELLDNVWGDQFVGDAALATRIKQVRAALGDDGRAQRVIATVHGRGYRFVAPLTVDGQSAPAPASPEAGPARSDDRLHNVPPARTELIGRGELIDEVGAALQRSRLVTLVGLGGAGKTSLAQEVGRRRAVAFRDGLWFVDLIPAKSAADIDRAVARAIGIQVGPTTSRADLLQLLVDREMCVVIDNCEHVLEAAAAFCGELLDLAPDVRVLATSREPLRVRGERRVPVGSLPLASDTGSALDLLDAVAERAGVSIPDRDQLAAVELCTRVDGLPLAIELVGARLGALTVPEVLDRLDRLADPDAEGAGRQASIGVILADTLQGLATDVVRLLAVTARVEGLFSADDVERLARHAAIDDPLAALATLVDHSVLAQVETPDGRRLRALEMVRQHVATNDPDPSATGRAHAEWCLEMLGDSFRPQFYDLEQANWVAERFRDLTAAHDHFVSEGELDAAARIVAATGLAMHLDDGSRAAEMLVHLDARTADVDDAHLLGRLGCAGVMMAMAAREPRAMFDQGLAAVEAADRTDDDSLRALARIMRSWAGVVVDIDGALTDLDEAIDLADAAGDDQTSLMATGYKVFHLAVALRFDEAVAIAEAAITRDLGRTSYPRRVVSTGLISLLLVDDPRRVLEIDSAVRGGAGLATFWGTSIVRASAHATLGELVVVTDMLHDLETRLGRAGISPLPDVLLVPAAVALHLGDDARASRYLGAVRAADRPTQSLMVSTAYRVLRRYIAPSAGIDEPTEAVWHEARDWIASLVS